MAKCKAGLPSGRGLDSPLAMTVRFSASLALRLTAVVGALSVALGAFGAHGLEAYLLEHSRVDTWKTAALYHLVHAAVLLALCLGARWRPVPWVLFCAGTLVFSGSLYLLCLTQLGWLGAVTPLGGLLLIAGWVRLIWD